MTLDIAYIGNFGRHGFNGDGPSYNLNPPNMANWALTTHAWPIRTCRQPVLADYQPVERQFYNGKFVTPYTDANGVTTNVVCCNGGIMGNYFGNDANATYNALQVKLQQNMSHGLQFIAHYTWSRALNHNGGYYAVDPQNGVWSRRPEPSAGIRSERRLPASVRQGQACMAATQVHGRT